MYYYIVIRIKSQMKLTDHRRSKRTAHTAHKRGKNKLKNKNKNKHSTT